MARLDDLKLSHRLFMESYRFRTVDWSPGARLRKPLSQSNLALITTAGLHLPEQLPFDLRMRGGDFTFREIPNSVHLQDLQVAHRSSAFDQTGAREDRNLVFPLDRLRELVVRGELGRLSRRHFSFMGSITAPQRLMGETGPEVASLLREDQVDGVFLVPV